MRVSNRGALAILLMTVAVGVFTTPALAGRSSPIVKIERITFTPAHLVVQRGDSVTWQFLDAQLLTHHNVTSIGRFRFKSSHTMFTGTYTVRFSRKGAFRYMCTIHDFMTGTVVVR